MAIEVMKQANQAYADWIASGRSQSPKEAFLYAYELGHWDGLCDGAEKEREECALLAESSQYSELCTPVNCAEAIRERSNT